MVTFSISWLSFIRASPFNSTSWRQKRNKRYKVPGEFWQTNLCEILFSRLEHLRPSGAGEGHKLPQETGGKNEIKWWGRSKQRRKKFSSSHSLPTSWNDDIHIVKKNVKYDLTIQRKDPRAWGSSHVARAYRALASRVSLFKTRTTTHLTLKTHPRAGCFWHVTRWVPIPKVSISWPSEEEKKREMKKLMTRWGANNNWSVIPMYVSPLINTQGYF